MSDKQARKYFENMPYGDDAKSSEIHGKQNQQIINHMITGLVGKYDEAMSIGDKAAASSYSGIIKQIAGDLNNLKEIKKQFATYYGGGTGGKNLFSNWTNLQAFDLPFFLEKGNIAFDNNLNLALSVTTPDGKSELTKSIQDITQEWVVKGTEENDYMKIQQDAVKQSNTMGNELDFDVDWAVDNLLTTNDGWKIFATDKIGGRYFLQDYVLENQEKIQSGEISDEMLHPTSFNPNFDTRLHNYYSNRVKKSFNKNYKSEEEKIQGTQEIQEADELMSRLSEADEFMHTTRSAIRKERKEHGKI